MRGLRLSGSTTAWRLRLHIRSNTLLKWIPSSQVSDATRPTQHYIHCNNYETVQTYGAVGCSFCVGMGVSPVLTWMCCVTAYVGSAGPTNPLKKVCVFGLLRAAKHAGRDVQCTTCPLLHAMIGAKSRGTSAVASASTSFLFFLFLSPHTSLFFFSISHFYYSDALCVHDFLRALCVRRQGTRVHHHPPPMVRIVDRLCFIMPARPSPSS